MLAATIASLLLVLAPRSMALVVCGRTDAVLDVRLCRELAAGGSAASVCASVATAATTTITFAQAAERADRAAVDDYARTAQQLSVGGAAFDQQRCMYAWRVARCAEAFVPRASSGAPLSDDARACQATCDAVRAACGGRTFELDCGGGGGGPRPPCSASFSAIANDECAADAVDRAPAPTRSPAPRTNPPRPPALPLPPRAPRRSGASSVARGTAVLAVSMSALAVSW